MCLLYASEPSGFTVGHNIENGVSQPRRLAQSLLYCVANYSSGDIGLFEPVDGTGSYDGAGEFSFPLDANSLSPNTVGANLCDYARCKHQSCLTL